MHPVFPRERCYHFHALDLVFAAECIIPKRTKFQKVEIEGFTNQSMRDPDSGKWRDLLADLQYSLKQPRPSGFNWEPGENYRVPMAATLRRTSTHDSVLIQVEVRLSWL